jgi:hypothetical protein
VKRVPVRMVLLLITVSLTTAFGCIYNELTGEIVVTDKVCVQFEETRTDANFYTYKVDERFRDRLMQALDESGYTLDDVVSANVVSGTYKMTKPPKPKTHDWFFSGNVKVARQDIPGGPYSDGPEPLINLVDQSLYGARGKPVNAVLIADGVAVLDRALEAVIAGEDPRLVLIMEAGNIVPAPTPADPLDFKWNACVTFQAVVQATVTE